MWSDDDIKFMSAALDVAIRGKGKVSPNPLVGCVLVKDGQIIAEGWHDHLGGLHAEQMAIHDAEKKGESPNGATAYVTLEPCNHFGRTPPCTEALMWAGVKSVVVAHPDPNPTVRGQGITVLQHAGITVKSGLLEGQAADQMRPFLHWCQYRKPIVTVKMAVDRNGSVDDRSKDAGRFTSQQCLDLVHQMRADSDAILVGVETVVRDNPSLLVSRVETSKQPLRIVIDPNARIPEDCQVLNDGKETLVLQDDFRDLPNILNRLGDMEIQTLMVEGGPITVKHFLDNKLVDDFFLIQSTVEHLTPYDSGINSQVLNDAGLTRADDQTWGEETVQYWSR
ncbi:MAG: bifunctional diaminohydroxyphosphoribosylaminopyrimidine deaminase/5-amino-6-(5-phosphoribosylamino)uracil reductase RibD [Candidatus Poseidoniaceae archaeon]|nr:bifunctional diaminohydroxyphosphoribosylaminopyrimidine deaminase/5-amino-6-(5-phosphoribosylamino)uracil reductase RibD [Candidatus Poseidoniaceae archaeon]